MSRQFRSDDTVKWPYGFGRGTYNATISGNETAGWNGSTRFHAYGNISGTAGQTSFTKPAGWGHKGLCLLIQMRGAGAGNWELANVDFSGAQAVADKPLQNTYNTSGNDVAQVIALNQDGVAGYNDFTVNAGVTFSAPDWNGAKGGVLAILAKGTVTINGTLKAYGANGITYNSGGAGASGGGFRGGSCGNGTGTSTQGEGTGGAGGASTAANGNGGGGASRTGGSGDGGGGGGGGNANAGTNGAGAGGASGVGGTGGSAAGNAGLTVMVMGGGGGGGRNWQNETNASGSGASGGGIVIIIASNIVINGSTGAINVNGGNGSSANANGGGGGGGSVLLKCATATLNTNRITATGGTVPATYANRQGGAGSVGRIHIDYKLSYTGSTNPGIDARQDLTLSEIPVGAMN